ncbi:MAG: hypothetical protein IJ088_13215 [Clostridia bacterium]|nr:hypothetical protein [Clostridia bacterium]
MLYHVIFRYRTFVYIFLIREQIHGSDAAGRMKVYVRYDIRHGARQAGKTRVVRELEKGYSHFVRKTAPGLDGVRRYRSKKPVFASLISACPLKLTFIPRITGHAVTPNDAFHLHHVTESPVVNLQRVENRQPFAVLMDEGTSPRRIDDANDADQDHRHKTNQKRYTGPVHDAYQEFAGQLIRAERMLLSYIVLRRRRVRQQFLVLFWNVPE